MKTRIDFVTNSSSSSFLVPVKKEQMESPEAVERWLFSGTFWRPLFDTHVSQSDIAKSVYQKLLEAKPLRECELGDLADGDWYRYQSRDWYPPQDLLTFLRLHKDCAIYMLSFEDHNIVEAEVEKGEILEAIGALIQSNH